MKNEKQMVQELQNRKKTLIRHLKELSKKENNEEMTEVEYDEKKEIERELVEIMDRLTQLNYIFKK